MIKLVFSAFIVGALTLSIQAMEQDSSTPINILPAEIKTLILADVEPHDVASFARTKKEHAQLVEAWLESPQVIGNLLMQVVPKVHADIQENFPTTHFESTLIETALKCGKVSAAEWLNVYKHDKPGVQELLNRYLSTYIKDLQAVRFLVKSGADINRKNQLSGETALIIISHSYEIKPQIAEIAKFIIDNNAQLNLTDLKGNTALHTAIGTKQEKIALMLIQAGADINLFNAKGETPLSLAITGRSIPLVEALIAKNVDVNKAKKGEPTPLINATIAYCRFYSTHALKQKLQKSITIMELLLKAGADVHAQTNQHSTALDIATHDNVPEAIELLKKYGADASEA
jgi:uncharacterized protein